MTHWWNPLALVHGANVLMLLPALVLAWRRRRLPGGPQAFFLLCAMLTWVAFVFLEVQDSVASRRIAWATLSYLGVSLTPFAYFLLSREFGTGRPRHRPFLMPILAIASLVPFLLALTNGLHHLLWTGFRTGILGQTVYLHGPAYVFVLGYNYSLFLFASLRMVYTVFHFPRHFWKMGALLLLAMCVPFLSNLAYSFGILPPGIDPTPMGLSFTGIALALALLRTGLLDIAPVAREQLFERMNEGVLVFDARARLVDFNRSALRILGHVPRIGDVAGDLPPPWSDLGTVLVPGKDASLELEASPEVCYEARVGSLDGLAARMEGHMAVLYDISERKAMERRLEELAIRDPLTGLSNRRHFSQALARELGRCAREGLPLSLVLLDIDHFKGINDGYGHAAGDSVLMRVGELLAGAVRGHDCAGRWGGEEFVMLLSGCPREMAHRRAQEWLLRLAREEFRWDGGTLHCTVSIGVSTFPDDGRQEQELLARCDGALYRSKREGRNRVSLAS